MHLCAATVADYSRAMRDTLQSLHLPILAGALLAAAGCGAVLAMWSDKGARIYMALVESGLSWCF